MGQAMFGGMMAKRVTSALRIVGAPIAGPAASVNVIYVALHNFLDSSAASAIVQCNMMALPRLPPGEDCRRREPCH
jgi:hypothetical protein